MMNLRVCVCVCLCCIDATAGVGSNEAKGGQPDSSGSHWPQEEEEESGITVLFCFSRGDIKQENLFCLFHLHRFSKVLKAFLKGFGP